MKLYHKMKPNILFVVIDGLRADQVFSKDRTSHTPFLDSIISSGVYFENTFSSSDGTTISLNCTFNSKFQFETGLRARKIILLEDNHLKKLKDAGYKIAGIIPNLKSLSPLSEYFENDEKTFEVGPPPETLPTGMSKRIKSLLNSLSKNQPWFCYLHLFDLHPLREGKKPLKIDDFDSEKFGDSPYSKTVSSIDYWLSKVLEDVDFKNTLLVITADHGERIPFGDKHVTDFEPNLKKISNTGKKILPKFTHEVSGKLLGNLKQKYGKTKMNFSNRELSQYEKRSRDPYFTMSLFDELLHVPFLLKGLELPQKIISTHISTLRIFPTILDLIKIPQTNSMQTKSLVKSINNQDDFDEEIFLHTSPYENEMPTDMIGIRSKKYKYFRHSREPGKNIHLYDLKNDPYENNNLASNNKKLVSDMEELLEKIQDVSKIIEDDITPEEEEEISKELKKLGYL